MRHPRTETAWLLVRKASGMSDETIIDGTGTSAETLQDMRQRCREMADMGHTPTGKWSRDQTRQGAIFMTTRG